MRFRRTVIEIRTGGHLIEASIPEDCACVSSQNVSNTTRRTKHTSRHSSRKSADDSYVSEHDNGENMTIREGSGVQEISTRRQIRFLCITTLCAISNLTTERVVRRPYPAIQYRASKASRFQARCTWLRDLTLNESIWSRRHFRN